MAVCCSSCFHLPLKLLMCVSFSVSHFEPRNCQKSNLRQFRKHLKASAVYFLAPSSRSCDCTPKIPPPSCPFLLLLLLNPPIHNNNTTTHATRGRHCACASTAETLWDPYVRGGGGREHEARGQTHRQTVFVFP